MPRARKLRILTKAMLTDVRRRKKKHKRCFKYSSSDTHGRYEVDHAILFMMDKANKQKTTTNNNTTNKTVGTLLKPTTFVQIQKKVVCLIGAFPRSRFRLCLPFGVVLASQVKFPLGHVAFIAAEKS